MPIKWTIFHGASLGAGECAFILRPHDEDDGWYGDGPNVSAVARWSRSSGFAVGLAPHRLDSIVALDPAAPRLAAITQLGTVAIVDGDSVSKEKVYDGEDGPNRHGYLMAARVIGAALYAAGMGRQVYRRSADGRWARVDKGVLDPMDGAPIETNGFLTVDGRSESEIYAAGLNGEIWSCVNGAWRRIGAPTNLSIHSLRVEAGGAITACGQLGLLLRREQGAWRALKQEFHRGDFTQLEFFGAAGFLATEARVFRISPWPELDSATVVENSVDRYATLSAGWGAMWMFGPRHAAVSADGQSWTELDLDPLWERLPRG